MAQLKGDFIGFTFNGVHSSDLGIVRVSEGTRFKEPSLPNMSDRTVQIPGSDGTYYFGSSYTQRPFDLSFAYDELTELQRRRIVQLFGDRKVHDLIFDEHPYKVYSVKANTPVQFNHICFDDGKYGRIYKGEGAITLVAYYPFARSRYKYAEDYKSITSCENRYNPYSLTNFGNSNIPEWDSIPRCKEINSLDPPELYMVGNDFTYDNKYEWLRASGIKNQTHDIDEEHLNIKHDVFTESEDEENTYICYTYNPGDLKTPFKLKLVPEARIIPEVEIWIDDDIVMTLKSFGCTDDYIVIDSTLNLIEGYSQNLTGDQKSGIIYNRQIANGNFGSIPIGEHQIVVKTSTELENNVEIDYNYLYY